MTKESVKANSESSKNAEPQFHIQRVYLKDLSFETPMGSKAFNPNEQLKINQELGTESKKIQDNLFETVLRLTITGKLKEETAFLVEVYQAGLFFIKGIEKQSVTRLLSTACPQILFPYAREAIDASLIKGTFPAIMLPPVNFDVLFEQAMAEKEAQVERSKPH